MPEFLERPDHLTVDWMSSVRALQAADVAEVLTAAPAKRKRGRPPGQAMKIAADQLKRHHFNFMRAVLELDELKGPWEQHLAFEGGPDDERHRAARLRVLVKLARLAADTRLARLQVEEPQEAKRLRPQIEQALQCLAAIGNGRHRTSRVNKAIARAEASEVRQRATGPASTVPLHSAVTGAEALPRACAARDLRPTSIAIDGLNALARLVEKPPSLADQLSAWLSPELARRLAGATVRGRAQAMVELGDLARFVNQHGRRWWRYVPRLGAKRAERLVRWLTSLAEELSHPLKEPARAPLHRIEAADAAVLRPQVQQDPDGARCFTDHRLLNDGLVLQGTIGGDPNADHGAPRVTIDGREISWEELGRVLSSEERQFKLELFARSSGARFM